MRTFLAVAPLTLLLGTAHATARTTPPTRGATARLEGASDSVRVRSADTTQREVRFTASGPLEYSRAAWLRTVDDGRRATHTVAAGTPLWPRAGAELVELRAPEGDPPLQVETVTPDGPARWTHCVVVARAVTIERLARTAAVVVRAADAAGREDCRARARP